MTRPAHARGKRETELGTEVQCSACKEFWPCDGEFFYMTKGVPHTWCKACCLASPTHIAKKQRWAEKQKQLRAGPAWPVPPRSPSMKKNILSLSIAAMIGGLAFSRPLVPRLPYYDWPPGAGDGLVVEPEGVGHILLVPYYSSQSHSNAPLSIVPPERKGKVVQVRFRGAAHSEDSLDFELFLSRGTS